MTNKKIVFSGIQPSGVIHLGNYLGAIKQWIDLQDKYFSIFCIVDMHAITVQQEPEELQKNIRELAAIYLASGLDPKKAIIFVQSDVSAHTELAWVLNCNTQMGELERMTQFKDKSQRHKQNINAGLFTYPALMAADILLYQTNKVPVGEDQRQHVELTRDIAHRVNNKYGQVFEEPEALLPEVGARIMGLDDPTSKMSKSASSGNNYIAMTDEPDKIRKKIMKAVTDSGSEVKFDEEKKPAISNLLTIYSLVTEKNIKSLEKEYAGKGYGDFKKGLAEAVVEFIEPIQKKYKEYIDDQPKLEKILTNGAKEAAKLAQPTMENVRKVVGLGVAND
ncbi:tryptophan--tRNA ligase [Patescibacteria group bacterium]|nr:tryptophan--tRNA ligase [Patescibacteria group bacterium]MBU1673979.1 tryptophan--tRNA ligase [Patescibacteria group bacterium]MBU1962947.1 tryptophan--tRNA ligase [Patescibacteria group bacterium]